MASSINGGAGNVAKNRKCRGSRICDHVAFALIAYTLMLIFVVTPAIKAEGMAIWPYFMLVVLVALMVPFCRNMERRWRGIEEAVKNEQMLDDGSLARRFTFDRCFLWLVALGVPPLIMLIFQVV